MNLVFRTVWNRTLGRLVVASEAARSQGKAGISTKLIGAVVGGAIALPLSTLAVGALTLDDGASLKNADGNINIAETSSSSQEVTLDLAQAIEIANQITVGSNSNVTINSSGLVLAGGPKVTSSGIDAGGEKISNVANGEDDSDAVNLSQLNAVSDTASKGWNISAEGGTAQDVAPDGSVDFSGDGNISVSQSSTGLSFTLADDLTAISLTTGNTKIDNNGLTVDGGPSVTSSGIDAGGNKITNVDDGVSDADAVNKGQLDDVSKTANAGWDLTAEGVNGTNVAPNDSVDLNNNDGNIEVSKTATDNDVTFDLADDIDVASVTAGDVTGNVTKVTATGTSVTDGIDSTDYGADGMTITGGPSVTSGGIDASDQKVTGVSAGDISSGSQDAVTGGQLFDLEEGLFTDGEGIKYFHANSTKADSQATGTDSVAIGPTSVADGNASFAAGLGANTSEAADNGIALGNQASAEAGNTLALGGVNN